MVCGCIRLEVKIPTIWRDEKQREEKSRREKRVTGARNVRKVAKHCVFAMICGSGGLKSRRSHVGHMRNEKLHAAVARSTFPSQNVKKTDGLGPLLEVQMSKNCTTLWREARFAVKMYKTHHVRSTFGSSDVKKLHAVFVARSTFSSQSVKNIRVLGHFWR